MSGRAAVSSAAARPLAAAALGRDFSVLETRAAAREVACGGGSPSHAHALANSSAICPVSTCTAPAAAHHWAASVAVQAGVMVSAEVRPSTQTSRLLFQPCLPHPSQRELHSAT